MANFPSFDLKFWKKVISWVTCCHKHTLYIFSKILFFSGMWNHLLTETVRNLADALDNLFIVLGPAFDYNVDGLPDDINNIPR